jgi:RNA-binding protein 25
MNPLNPLNPNFVIPPHLQDLQESDLPENQRGLVISEIALFRERAAKRERDKAAAEREKGGAVAASRSAGVGGFSGVGAMGTVPSGPKERVWGRPAGGRDQHQQQQGWGRGAQGYSKPVGFVRGEDNESYNGRKPGENEKTDEELERDRKEARRREEDISFRDVSFAVCSVT